MKRYEVLQMVLRAKLASLKMKNLSKVENVINGEAAKGWALHVFGVQRPTESGNSLAAMFLNAMCGLGLPSILVWPSKRRDSL